MMRLLVCGNRDWTDRDLIRETLLAFERRCEPGQIRLIHGGNGDIDNVGLVLRGADLLAAECAIRLGWETIGFPVYEHEWQALGSKAGPLRNERMIDEGKPTHGIAFGTLRKGQKWTGTGDMVCRLIDAGVPVRCYPRRK